MGAQRFLPASILMLLLPLAAHASNPIPGVGIVVKHCSSPAGIVVQDHCKPTKALRVAGGFFGPGSVAVDEHVELVGRCAHACGCENDCAGSEANPDGRIDYSADSPAGPFDMSMPATTFYSHQPIAVDIGGVTSFFDVFVTISNVTGLLSLPSGQALPVGGTSQVESSYLDLHCATTFANAITGEALAGSIEEDLHLGFHAPAGLPVARFADGTPEGRIVLGLDGATPLTFTYAGANDELVLMMRSLIPAAPVAITKHTWGALKSTYR